MPLAKEKKEQVISQYGGKSTNTGSIEGQIALLTERISQIAGHLWLLVSPLRNCGFQYCWLAIKMYKSLLWVKQELKDSDGPGT